MNWSKLRKDFMNKITHDDNLVYYGFHGNLLKVIEILEIRFSRSTKNGIESKDLKALSFIVENEIELKILYEII